jgi:predicted dehydrogenase
MSHNISVLIVGCGSIGERHARNLSRLGIEFELYDSDPKRMGEVSSEYDVPQYEQLSDALTGDTNLAFVCTPHDTHIPIAQEALNQNYDLFVEKPLSNTQDDAFELISRVRDSDVVHMIGCNYRFHPAIATVKSQLDDGNIGQIYSANISLGSYLPDWHPWEDHRQMYSAKPGVGGVLLDNIHAINFANWFFDGARSTMAYIGYDSNLEIPTADRANLIIEYNDGILCSITVDYLNRQPLFSGHITGELGTIRWGPSHKSVQVFDPVTQSWNDLVSYADWETNDMYMAMTNHLLTCVRDGIQTSCTLEDGFRDLQMALAARESHLKGERVYLDDRS